MSNYGQHDEESRQSRGSKSAARRREERERAIDEWIEREVERVGPLPDWVLEDAARVIEQDRRERRERQEVTAE